MKIPRILTADAYTVGSGPHVSPEAKKYSAYQIIFRKSPNWLDDLKAEKRFISHGLQRIMADLFTDPVTKDEVDEAEEFLLTFHAGGTPFRWDRSIWDRIVQEKDGMIPIRIRALADGAVTFPGEPSIQVEGEDGFGELAGYFESKLLQVWAPSERATLMRHWLNYNRDLVRKCHPSFLTNDQLNFMAALQTHDFGDRAGSCAQESEVLGLAHLTSHFGTDTVAAAYLAWQQSEKMPWGCSIKALAHRIVQGYKEEKDAYLSLYEAEPQAFTSHVADCYNFYTAIDNYLVPLALRAKATGGVIVARPDSGDPLEQILYAMDAAKDAGLAVQAKNGMWGMTHLRTIQGDGMTFKTIQGINEALMAKGYSPPDCNIYGIGGYIRNAINRDNFGATMKLCAVGEQKRPVMKFSHTPGKGSVPGLAKICRIPGEPTVRSLDEAGEDQMLTWYDGVSGKGIVYKEDFRKVRARVLNEFQSFPYPEEIFSPAIKKLKKELHAKYVRGPNR